VAAEARDAGWDFMAHAYEQIPLQKQEDQRGMIHRAMDVIERFVGKRSVGWLGPGLTQTLETPDLLTEAGVRYIGDWVYDDEPTDDRDVARPARHASYNFETHDLATFVLQHHESPYWLKKCQDNPRSLHRRIVRAHQGHGDRVASVRQWASRIGSAISKRPTPTSRAGRASFI